MQKIKYDTLQKAIESINDMPNNYTYFIYKNKKHKYKVTINIKHNKPENSIIWKVTDYDEFIKNKKQLERKLKLLKLNDKIKNI